MGYGAAGLDRLRLLTMETSEAIGNGYDAACMALWSCLTGGGGGWLGCKHCRGLQSSQKGIIGKEQGCKGPSKATK
jgi:hypothetical protein